MQIPNSKDPENEAGRGALPSCLGNYVVSLGPLLWPETSLGLSNVPLNPKLSCLPDLPVGTRWVQNLWSKWPESLDKGHVIFVIRGGGTLAPISSDWLWAAVSGSPTQPFLFVHTCPFSEKKGSRKSPVS